MAYTVAAMGRRVAVPILMYHKVGGTVHRAADRQLNVPAERFALHMRLLARLGFQGVTLSKAMASLQGGPMRRRQVCITFDDGFECVAAEAAPVLRQRGWPATVLAPSAFVGELARWPGIENWTPERLMDAAALQALQAQGWEIGGHTRSHADLSALDDVQALDEIRRGMDDLQALTGVPVRTFAYPYGRLNERTPSLVKRAGLSCAVTTRSGVADAATDPFRLPRVKVASRDDTVLFLYRLLLRRYLP